MTVLIYTPTYGDGPRLEMMESVSLQTFTDYDHEVSWNNPLPERDNANVVAEYQRAREMCLAGGYDALLTIEHDMIIPPNTIEKLYNTDAPVVYGVYMLRHGTPTLNAWQYVNNRNLGMSLSLYPNEVKKAHSQGWIEVCGTGWGCTLIRREVLERLTIHSAGGKDAGDLTFSTECLRNGFRQIARFDVPCGHILPDGKVLEVGETGGIVNRVYALIDVTVNVDGQSLAMKKGRYYTVPLTVGQELQRAGYVRITNDDDSQQVAGEREQPDITAREMAVNPKAATRSKRSKKK